MDKLKLNINKLSKEKSQLLVLYFLVVVILLASYFYFFLQPKIRMLQETLPKVNRIQKALAEADRLIANTVSLKEEIATLKEEVGCYESQLPTEKEIPVILDHLSELSSQEKVTIVSIKELGVRQDPEAEGEEQVYHEIPIAIEMKSGYHQLSKFVNQIENSDRLMKINDVEIKSDLENLSEHNIQIVISCFVLVKE